MQGALFIFSGCIVFQHNILGHIKFKVGRARAWDPGPPNIVGAAGGPGWWGQRRRQQGAAWALLLAVV